MLHEQDKAKWWRPRFSVRTLATVVTMICLHLGSWELTKWGATNQVDLDSVNELPESIERWVPVESGSPCPFVIRIEAADWPGSFYVSAEEFTTTTYYIWFFGAKLRIYGPGMSYTRLPFADVDNLPSKDGVNDPFGKSDH